MAKSRGRELRKGKERELEENGRRERKIKGDKIERVNGVPCFGSELLAAPFETKISTAMATLHVFVSRYISRDT